MSRFKALFIGDPHVTVQDLDDSRNMVEFARKTAVEQDVDALIWLGDQSHSMSVVHVPVMAYLFEAFRPLQMPNDGRIIEQIALVGNHDRPGVHGSKDHSMLPYKNLVLVVDEPITYKHIRFVPYQNSIEELYAACKEDTVSPTLVCHATFNGAQFENGFYASDGADLDLIPQPKVISGHIHLPSTIGKLHYVGAPRWRTASDANHDRAIEVVTFEDGTIVSSERFSTNDICRRILVLEDTPEALVDLSGIDTEKDDVRVSIVGPAEFVDARKALLAASGVKIKTIKTDAAHTKVKESEGIDIAFAKYVSAFVPQNGASKQALEALVTARLT